MILNDEDDPVGALIEQAHGLPDGCRRVNRHWSVETGVCILHPADLSGDEVCRDVLGKDSDAATTGDRLSHPSAGDRGHVGHHEW